MTGASDVAGGTNPMAAMMQDPTMMQAAMQMMGGMGGNAPGMAGVVPGVGAGNPDPMTAMMGGMDPAMLGQMLQNPMIQQMTRNLAQNPQLLQQMIQSNPMLQQMTQNNPMMAQMFSNPQIMQNALQLMSNPEMHPQITHAMTADAPNPTLANGTVGGAQQTTMPLAAANAGLGANGGMNPMA